MRFHLFSCEVFCREICHVMARSRNEVDLRLLPKGLHNDAGLSMRQRIQDCID